MKTKVLVMGVLIGVLFWFVSTTLSEPSKPLIFYSKAENGLGNGNHIFRFSLWNAEKAGNIVWEEQKKVIIQRSTINTFLGEVNSLLKVDFSKSLWIQVEERKSDGSYRLVGGREVVDIDSDLKVR